MKIAMKVEKIQLLFYPLGYHLSDYSPERYQENKKEIFGNLLEKYKKGKEEIKIQENLKKTIEEILPEEQAIGDLSAAEKFLAPKAR